ncbi:MAG: MGMT family protein [Candidatus Micrarchaeaceae archaeon]
MLERHGLTDFQKKVLLETLKIPRGKTASYKEIAIRIGRPNAYRAVGTALRKNPLPIVLPCHRVILSSGRIGNYSGGSRKKLALLKAEHANVGITVHK